MHITALRRSERAHKQSHPTAALAVVHSFRPSAARRPVTTPAQPVADTFSPLIQDFLEECGYSDT